MLYRYEKIDHIKGLPLKVFCVRLSQKEVHWHGELEILFVLKGKVEISLGEKNYILEEEDVFLVNSYEIHGFKSITEDNIILALQLDTRYFSKYKHDLDHMRFDVNFISENHQVVFMIKYFLANMVMALEIKKESMYLLLMGMANFLISYLIEDFHTTIQKNKHAFINDIDRKRLIRIVNYIYSEYTNKITLQDIAEREHLSRYYISHFIKEKLNISFQNLLNQLRLEHAIKLINSTSNKLLDISMSSGFSDVKYLNKLIKEQYGMTVSEYRKNYQHVTRLKRMNLEDLGSLQEEFDYSEVIGLIKKYVGNMWKEEDVLKFYRK